MAVSTFGVSLTVVREYMPGLPATLDGTTYPTNTQFTAMLSRKAAIWCARAENQAGVDITMRRGSVRHTTYTSTTTALAQR